jgi:hypothetical protein
VAVALHFDERGEAHPSIDRLREAAGDHTSRGGIVRGLKRLIDAGILRRTKGGGGRGRTTSYRAAAWNNVDTVGETLPFDISESDSSAKPMDPPAAESRLAGKEKPTRPRAERTRSRVDNRLVGDSRIDREETQTDMEETSHTRATARLPELELEPPPDHRDRCKSRQQLSQAQPDLVTPTPEVMLTVWNNMVRGTRIPGAWQVTPARRRRLAAIVSELCEDNLEGWHSICRAVVEDPWCRGERPGRGHENWTATIDWVLKGDNALRYLERSVSANLARERGRQTDAGFNTQDERMMDTGDPELDRKNRAKWAALNSALDEPPPGPHGH